MHLIITISFVWIIVSKPTFKTLFHPPQRSRRPWTLQILSSHHGGGGRGGRRGAAVIPTRGARTGAGPGQGGHRRAPEGGPQPAGQPGRC